MVVKKRLFAILLSVALAFTMMPLIGGAVYADDDEPTNLHWYGTAASWDQIQIATEYEVVLLKSEDEGNTYNNPGSAAYRTKSISLDLADEIEEYGEGLYKFYINVYDGSSWHEYSIFKSDVYTASYHYTVTFDANGGSGSMEQGKSITGLFKLPECTFTAPEGKHFAGWAATHPDNDVIIGNSISLSESETTLYAIWEKDGAATNLRWDGTTAKWDPVEGADRYFVYLKKENADKTDWIYLNNGGTIGVYPEGTCEIDLFDYISRNGDGNYKFCVGYYLNGKDYYFMDTYSPVYKATYDYKVTFDANGGSGSMKSSGSFSGEFMIPDECTFVAPTGKQFSGWSLTSNGEAITDSTITLTGDTTLYAVWIDKIKVTKINLSQTKMQLKLGGSRDITVSFEPENAFTDYTFESNNPNITVTQEGKVTVLNTAKDKEQGIITVRDSTDSNVTATCTVIARDFEPQNLRWDGMVAKWDPIDDVDRYFIYFGKYDEDAEDWVWLPNGSTTHVYPYGACEIDLSNYFEEYGPGTYMFKVGLYMDGKDYYFMDIGSPTYTYSGQHEHAYEAGNITKATSQEDGKITYTCSCGDSYEEIIPAITDISLSAKSYTYDGKVKSPELTIKDKNGNVLTADTDYTVKVPSGRKNVGTYKYEITFIGDKYYGTSNVAFAINPVKTSITKLTKARKAFTVKWTKKSTQVTGYRIQYSTSSKFTSGTTKTTTVKSYKTTYKKIKGLKAKKTYYVRVQTYKTVSGKNYYSDWSAVKTVKTK